MLSALGYVPLPQSPSHVDLKQTLGFPGSCLNKAARAPKHPLPVEVQSPAALLAIRRHPRFPAWLRFVVLLFLWYQNTFISFNSTSRGRGILLKAHRAPGVKHRSDGVGQDAGDAGAWFQIPPALLPSPLAQPGGRKLEVVRLPVEGVELHLLPSDSPRTAAYK